MDNTVLAGYLKKQIQKYVGGVDLDGNKTATINSNGTTVINPSSGKDGMEKATVTVAVPVPTLEANKSVSVDVSNYSEAIEITPSSQKDAMQKVTLTLNNIPSGGDIPDEYDLYEVTSGTGEIGSLFVAEKHDTLPSSPTKFYAGILSGPNGTLVAFGIADMIGYGYTYTKVSDTSFTFSIDGGEESFTLTKVNSSDYQITLKE